MDNKVTEAIVLAGGFGTRLKEVVHDVPKPMAEVNRKPFLHYILQHLSLHGIKTVVLSVGYKHEIIQDFFGSHYLQMDILYAIESEPLGTGGAIKLALNQIKNDQCFVLNGDTFLDVDFKQISTNHNGACTLASVQIEDAERYGTLEINEQNQVLSFKEKAAVTTGWINAGVYLLDKSIFNQVNETTFSFEKTILPELAMQKQLTAIKCEGYFKDIGIPEDYFQFQKDNYKELTELGIDKSWTLFLDRDGVINERLIDDYVKLLNELKIIEGVPQAVAAFNKLFNRIVVVTNQQGIGRGMMTADDLEDIHGFIANVFEGYGGKISKWYFAPQLRSENSNYRKPGTGMGLHAQRDYPEIKFSKSVLIGDSESDIEFGMKLGMKTILLTNSSNVSTKADYIFKNLQSVANALKTDIK
ncbi:MAG: HAD-IIIA family hydrolase [Crocinitomicaceae bacterium]